METNYIDADGMEFLRRVTPFPGIVDGLNDIIANNNFKGCPQPFLEFSDALEEKSETSKKEGPRMPQLRLMVLNPTASLFEAVFLVSINLWGCDLTRDGKSAYDCLLYSRFGKLFRRDKLAWNSAVVAMDIMTAARFMTYYLSLYGFHDPSELKIGRHMSFTSRDISKMKLPSFITVPDPFRRAVAKLKELPLSYCDSVYLRMSGSSDRGTNDSMMIHSYSEDYGDGDCLFLSYDYEWKNRSEVERLRAYENFDCLDARISGDWCNAEIHMDDEDLETTARFLTDFFLFLNPGVKIDEIVVSLDFSACRDYDSEDKVGNKDEDVTDWLFSFYPDGSEDESAKMEILLKALEKMRSYYEEKFEEECGDTSNVDDVDEDGLHLNFKEFFATEPSYAIMNTLENLVVWQGGKTYYFYDGDDKLVMVVGRQNLSGFYFQDPKVKTVCTFYLSKVQKDAFDKLYFGVKNHRYEYDGSNEEVVEVTVCLQSDDNIAGKYISYWLAALGYDPELLKIKEL